MVMHDVLDQTHANLRIIKLAPDDPRWDAYVSGRADALPFHLPGWSLVLQEGYGFRPAALACMNQAGQITGILPLMVKKSLRSGVHLSSLPTIHAAGPCADDDVSIRALLRGAAARVDDSAARWLQVMTLNTTFSEPVDHFSRIPLLATHMIDLPADPRLIRFGDSRNHATVMRMIRQADRHGVIVREATSLGDLRRWYRLYLHTMHAHSTPPRSFRLFESIWQVLAPQHRRLLLAEKTVGSRTELLAGCLFLLGGQTVTFLFNGRDPRQLHLRPNEAIHWRAITEACAAGFRWYDMGTVMPGNQGLQRFKEKWGAQPAGIYRYRYPQLPEQEYGIVGEDALRRRVERAWRWVPLPATPWLGGWIYRHI